MALRFPCRPLILMGLLSVIGSALAAPNQPPTVSITGPASGSAYVALAQVTITANAADSDGSVTQVEFFQGSTLVGVDTTAPYSIQWNNVPVGNYSLTAMATDNGGETTISAAILVGVTAPPLAAPVAFNYDSLGRLVGMRAAGANVATHQYLYDSVGNISSINEVVGGQVVVVGFAPGSGSVGSAVVIEGAGFSTTPGQNTVNFNGVVASVSAATETQLTAVVPVGATTGPINVTTPSGSASSANNYTVIAGPSISGFTPLVAAAGTAVTVTGSNFVPSSLTGNKVNFNNSISSVSSSTATSLVTSVPSATSSGRIKISTPQGVAVSTSDFIIPPPGYSVSNIDSTSRMAVGETKSIAVSSASKISMLLFDGVAGQKVSVKINSSTIGSCASGKVLIIKPDASTLSTLNGLCGGDVVDSQSLPVTGTYSIVIDPYSTSTGSASLTLYNAPNVIGTMVIDGANTVVATTVPGQYARLTFSGSAGQRVFMRSVSDTYSDFYGITIYKPDSNGNSTTVNGNIFNYNSWNAGYDTETLVLPSTGVYTVFVNPKDADTGSVTLRLTSVPSDTSGTIAIDGSDVAIATTAAGQNSYLTFSGVAGQRIFMRAISDTYPDYFSVTIYKPDAGGNATTTNGYIYSESVWYASSVINTDVLVLPVTGVYTVYVNPKNADTGSVTFRLTSVLADASGTMSIDGPDTAIGTTTAGQNSYLTFSGVAGQRIFMRSPSESYADSFRVTIYKPDAGGSQTTANGNIYNNSTWYASSVINTDVLVLPATGVYTVYVDPRYANTGSVTFRLTSVPADFTGSVVINGSALPVTIGAAGQNARVIFSGTTGQSVTVRITGNSSGSIAVSLLRPDGSTQTTTSSSLSLFNLSPQALGVTGDYTVLINPSNANTGSVNVAVTAP